jgi:chromosome segregation ATPase
MTEPIARVVRQICDGRKFDVNLSDGQSVSIDLDERVAGAVCGSINAIYSTAVKSLESERDGLREEVKELKYRMEGESQLHGRIAKENEALRAEVEKLKEELESHAWEISPAMAQEKIDQLNAEVAAKNDSIKELKDINDSLKFEMTGMEITRKKDNEYLLAEVAELKAGRENAVDEALERAAKECDNDAEHFKSFADHARRKGHSVEDIVSRRIACEDLAGKVRAMKSRGV